MDVVSSGAADVAARSGSRAGQSRWPLRRSVAFVLDLIIVIYALALLVVLTTGGIDLGVVTLTEASKPVLVLLLLLPLRVTIDQRFWPLDVARRSAPAVERLTALRSTVVAAIPPAVVDVAYAFAVTRLATSAVGFVANVLFVSPTRARAFSMPFRTQRFAETFAAWDSGWYFDIASRGYYFNPRGQSSIAFFPLYPMLMRAVAWPFGGGEKTIWLAGILVSCTAFALALVALHRFTERVFGDRETAARTVLYLAIFPFSLFFTRVYAESIFLLTTVLAVSRAHDGRWWRAGGWGALAAIARPNGILIGVPLAFMAMAGRPRLRELAARFAALLLIPLALAGYCAYVYTLSGDPLGWLSAQAQWGYSLGHPPWEQLLKLIARIAKHGLYDYFFISQMAPYRLFHGVVALIFLGLAPSIFKRLGAGLGCYVLASLLVPLSGNALEGVGRYSSVLFPAFMVLGTVKSQRWHEAILIVSALFLALFVCLFVTGLPIY
jgi:Gpi18-like mannosyltransferase